MLNDEQFDEFKQFVAELIAPPGVIDTRQHHDDHEFIEILREREQRAQERWENIKTQLLGWGIVGIAGMIGTWAANKMGIHL